MSIFSKINKYYDESEYEKLLDLEQEASRSRNLSDQAYSDWADTFSAVAQYEEDYPRETNQYFDSGPYPSGQE